MKNFRQYIPAHVRFLVAVHLVLLLIFTVFRSITLLYNRPSLLFSFDRTQPLWKAFLVGFHFDITVASYAMLVPFALLSVVDIFRLEPRRLHAFVRFYCGFVVFISLAICAADVPYFNFFNSRLTSAAVHWKNNVQVARYVFTEVKYYPVIAIIVAGIWGIGRLIRKLWARLYWPQKEGFGSKILATSLTSILLLVGIWGGATPKKPDMKSAYFSNDGFYNQLTLNPVHTWFDSYFDFDINLCSIEEALLRVQVYFHIPLSRYASPIAKERPFQRPSRPMNVVVVLMESMSANRMGIFGNPNGLTPTLDSLARENVFFDNFYSNGIHTNAGIYSTLYSMPIMMLQHPMNNGLSENTNFSGLPVTLREKGYSTHFFCTHPKAFDNLDVFLQRNGFEHISDQSEYPQDSVANSWGVGDETMFNHAFTTLDSLAHRDSKQPFFATLLTITAHPPYTLPAFTRFQPKNTDPILQTYEYADWSIKNFMASCASADWFDNTIFVFLGDHGVNMPTPYDVPLSYNHVPLIICAPGLFKLADQRHQLANQTDVYPTIMGLLRLPYVQNTLGFDLFREKRPYAFFSQDHKLGVISDRYLYVARKSGRETLYDYRKDSAEDLLPLFPAEADSMRNFACNQLQVAQWMINNGQTNSILK